MSEEARQRAIISVWNAFSLSHGNHEQTEKMSFRFLNQCLLLRAKKVKKKVLNSFTRSLSGSESQPNIDTLGQQTSIATVCFPTGNSCYRLQIALSTENVFSVPNLEPQHLVITESKTKTKMLATWN